MKTATRRNRRGPSTCAPWRQFCFATHSSGVSCVTQLTPTGLADCAHRPYARYVTRRWPAALALAAIFCAVSVGPASARWYGSKLRGAPNVTYGCEAAAVFGPLGGIQLAATDQRSCTYRHGGYLFSNRLTFNVPATGKITHIRVKSGPRPAKLRLTVLTGSSRVNPFTGRDVPGTYTCCTARYVSRPFRVRANRTTTKRVNVRVYNVRSKRLQYRIHSSDGLALSAEGSGTVPLRVLPTVGNLTSGTPLAIGYWPRTRKGDPRVEGYSMAGIDLLFAWNFRRR